MNKQTRNASSHGNRLTSFKLRDTTGGYVPGKGIKSKAPAFIRF